MAAPKGNQNAAKKLKRLDVHVSLADTKDGDRRSRMERYMRSLGEEDYTELDMIHVCQQWLYDWIDGLNV